MFPEDEFFRLAPDGAGGAAGGDAGAAGAGGGTAVADAAPAAGTGGGEPAPVSTGAPALGGGAAAPVTPEQYEDIRDYAKSQGLDLSHLPSSSDAAAYLINLARGNNAYVQYGQQVAPHFEKFQSWLKEQEKAPKPAAEKKNYFGLPEFDDNLLQFLTRDSDGKVVPTANAPPGAVAQFMAYQQARQAAEKKLFHSPQELLEPIIKDLVQPLLEQHVQQHLGHYQEQVFAQQFISQNTQWLHQRDPAGNLIQDPISRQPMLTAEGRRFAEHLQAAEQNGLRGIQAQQIYAMEKLELDLLRQKAGTAAATKNGDGLKDDFLTKHNRRTPNAAGSTTPPTNPNRPNGSQNSELSLADRMRNALKAEGITDDDIAKETTAESRSK